MARAQGRVQADVLFLDPGEKSEEGWADSGLIASAAAIPGVAVIPDPDGRTAREFGAVTSGQAMLYDPDGRLLFSGGMTSGRGHEGDNFGAQAILAHLLGNSNGIETAPVFGCALSDSPPLATVERES
jgi:hypothetical protein